MDEAATDTEGLLQRADWVRSLARRLVADEHLADDAAQDTLLVALRSKPGLPRPAWLAAVLRNVLRMTRRAEARRRRREETAARAEALPSAAELAERLSVHELLLAEVQRLPEPFRTVVVLRFFEDQPLRRIAAHCGIPLATATSRLRRGIERLRRRLDDRVGSRRHWVLALSPLLSGRRSPRFDGRSIASRAAWAGSAAALVVAAAIGWFGIASHGGAAPRDRSLPSVALAVPDSASAARAADVASTRVPAAIDRGESTSTDRIVGGRIDGSIGGRVVDAFGVPLAAVGVVLVDPGVESPAFDGAAKAPTVTARGRTDAAGRFALPVARFGNVFVDDPRWVTVLSANVWPAAAGERIGERIVVAAPPLRVAGSVVDSAGAPVARSRLAIEIAESFRAAFALPLNDSVIRTWRAVADEHGDFCFPCAPSVASATLVVEADGMESARIAVAAAESPLRVVLARSAGPELRGEVVDRDGAAVAGATVALDGERIATTGADGTFRFAARAGAHRIVAAAPGRLPAVLEIPPDGRTTMLRMALGGAPRRIAGRVVDAARRPLPGAWVWILDPTVLGADGFTAVLLENVLSGRDTCWHVRRADAEGRFELDGLAARAYRLRACVEGSARFAATGPVAADSTDVVLVHPDDAAVAVAGTLRDSDGAPLAGVRTYVFREALHVETPAGVCVSWFTHGPEAITDENGRFALRDVPVGARVCAAGDGILVVDAPVPETGTVELVALRECGLQVSATFGDAFSVVDAEGVPIAAGLRWGDATRPSVRIALADGRSPVISVPDTARNVVLYAGRDEVARTPVRVRPGCTETIRF